MGTPPTVALLTLGNPARVTGGYLYHRRMAEMAPRYGVHIEFLSFPEYPFPLAAAHAPRLLRQAEQMDAQALILDSIVAALVGAQPLRPSLPMVAMLHQPPGGIGHGPPRSSLQGWLDRRAYRWASRLMVASDWLFDRLKGEGVPPHRLRVVPPGRDVAETSADPLPDLRRGRQVALLCVGNWAPHKGIHELLAAFARLPHHSATLHLVGDDTVEPRYSAGLQARLARPDLVDRVVVHGVLPRRQVSALYRAADAFVLPGGHETYGTVYGEAMAAGLPVVGWRAGNLPYLARDQQDGLLLPLGDVAGLTEALRRLSEDSILRRQLGEGAAKRAATFPTWEQTAERFFAVIREVRAEL